MNAPDEQRRDTTPAERGAILVDLLDLTDALPPVPHVPLTVPTFSELCQPR